MKKCNPFQEQLVDFLYFGSEKEAVDLIAHLKECEGCCHELNQMAKVREFFSQMPVLEPRREVSEKILEESIKNKKPKFNPSLVLNWNLASVVVVLVFIFSILTLIQSAFLPDSQIRPLPLAESKNQPLLSEVVPSSSFMDPEDLRDYGLKSVAVDEKQSKSILHDFERRRQMLWETDADTLLMRGRRYKTMGRMDLALKDFETIYNFYPNYAYLGDVLMYRAQCYAFLGQMEKALNSLDHFIKKYPSKKSLILPMMEQLKAAESKNSSPLENLVP